MGRLFLVPLFLLGAMAILASLAMLASAIVPMWQGALADLVAMLMLKVSKQNVLWWWQGILIS
jgi:hypothetical protein